MRVSPLLLALAFACNSPSPTGNDAASANVTPPLPTEVSRPLATAGEAPAPGHLELPTAQQINGAEAAPSSVEPPPAPLDPALDWKGPFLAVTETSAGIYDSPSSNRKGKIGYAEEGARLAVFSEVTKKDNCPEGWYHLVSGGYVCGKNGTTNLSDGRVRNAPRQPNLEGVLPYRYARNAKNGTPLYRSVPTPEQVRIYEPDRFKDKNAAPAPSVSAPAEPTVQQAKDDQQRRMAALRDARRAMLGEEAAKKLEAAEAAERGAAPSPTDNSAAAREWWQDEAVELHKIKLGDLQSTGDHVLSKRMVKGFYIAIERQFEWNNRNWYRSTRGEVAPADRVYEATGSSFKGVELGDNLQLPIGWTYGLAKNRTRYELDASGHFRAAGAIDRFIPVPLTGQERGSGKNTYVEAVGGFWLKRRDLRIASTVQQPPADLAADERWVDVNLGTQTVVLYSGITPLYATLISSGKENDDPEKDHRTPVGEWRIREKHVTATMDGDGTAAGDLPYSIESVPYVMYFNKSYALHGAFWHQNYGVRMSHGCVNLAPLDAKYLFFHTDPPVAVGWSGTFAAEDRPGSRVVVHD